MTKIKKNVFLAVTALSVISVTAYASRHQSIERHYFSDATHSVLVGEGVFPCSGHHYITGQATQYYVDVSVQPCSISGDF